LAGRATVRGMVIAEPARARLRVQPRSMTMATAKKTPAKASATAAAARTDATALLQRDHAEVKKLFKQYEKLADAEADGAERGELAAQICAMLTVHATIEEEIFYPAARAAEVDADLLDEADVEHASAKDLISQIESMSPDDELYDAKVSVLGEYIDHHVQEEEGEMFPKCRKSEMDLAALAEALAERKSELMAEA
jgi:hemerythrin superfamily protein